MGKDDKMIHKESFTISAMLMRQVLEKYNNQNAKFNVEYIEAVLDDDTDTEIIGPRSLTLNVAQCPYRGLWIRKHSADDVVMVSYLKLKKMNKDFCIVEIAYDDDEHYWATYEEFRRS